MPLKTCPTWQEKNLQNCIGVGELGVAGFRGKVGSLKKRIAAYWLVWSSESSSTQLEPMKVTQKTIWLPITGWWNSLWFSKGASLSNSNHSEVSTSCDYCAKWQQVWTDWRVFQWLFGIFCSNLMFQNASLLADLSCFHTSFALKCLKHPVFRKLGCFLPLAFVKNNKWFHTLYTVLASD